MVLEEQSTLQILCLYPPLVPLRPTVTTSHVSTKISHKTQQLSGTTLSPAVEIGKLANRRRSPGGARVIHRRSEPQSGARGSQTGAAPLPNAGRLEELTVSTADGTGIEADGMGEGEGRKGVTRKRLRGEEVPERREGPVTSVH